MDRSHVVVGSPNADVTVRVADLPRPGHTVFGGSLLQAPGGKGATQAVAAALPEADVISEARTLLEAQRRVST